MKFLIDNALSPLVAQGLQQVGYDAVHVRELQMQDADDIELFALAASSGRIIVSADTDFGTLLAFRETTKPSFILFRQTDKRPKSQLNFLYNNLPKLKKDLIDGAVIVVEDERLRIRALPIIKE